MAYRTFVLFAALATLAACGGRSAQLEVRTSPQAKHYLDGSPVVTAQQGCTGVNRYLCTDGNAQPATGY